MNKLTGEQIVTIVGYICMALVLAVGAWRSQ